MIDDKHDKFDQLLGDKLSSMREMPSEGVWDRIEATLAQMEAPAVVAAPAEPKRLPLWSRSWVGISTAVAAAVALFVGVVVFSEQSTPEELVASAVVEEVVAEEEFTEPTEPTTPNVEQMLAAATPQRLAMADAPKSTDIVAQASIEEQEATTIEASAEIVATATQKATTAATSKTTTKRTTRRSQRKSAAEIEEYWRGVLGQEEEPSRGISILPSEVKLYANNIGFDQGHIHVKDVSQSAMLMSESPMAGGDATLAGNPTFMKTQRKKSSELKHYMPVSVGLNASFALNDWLSVESGLHYTNLYSSSDNTGNVSTYHYSQNLHYIGIPLAASIRFIDFGPMSLYAKAGASAEVCVSASNRQYIDNVLNHKQKIDTEGLQIGLNAAAGVSYGIWNNLGLFAEAGVAYWTATKPQPTNYRTEHPLGFSFMAGVRLSFR